MTPKERAAMQQALEALESAPIQYDFNSYPMLVMSPETLQTTLTALREALAEQQTERTQDAKRNVVGLAEQAEQEPTNLCQNSTELVEKDCGGAHHHCYAGSFGG